MNNDMDSLSLDGNGILKSRVQVEYLFIRFFLLAIILDGAWRWHRSLRMFNVTKLHCW